MTNQLSTLHSLAKQLEETGSAPSVYSASISIKSPSHGGIIACASGTSAAGIDANSGWVHLSLDKLHSLTARPELLSLPPAAAERFLFDELSGCVVESRGKLPLDIPLHALLDEVVIHAHPVAANAIACHPEAEAIVREIGARDANPPLLWVPYRDPGPALLAHFAHRINAFQQARGRLPDLIVLENCGIFCSAPDAARCTELLNSWIERLIDYFGPIHPIDQQPSIDVQTRNMVDRAVTMACRTFDLERPMIRFSEAPELLYATRNKSQEAFFHPLSPDHVRHNGPRAAAVAREAHERDLLAQLRVYLEEYRSLPRLIVVEQKGVCITGYDPAELDQAEALAAAAIQSVLLAKTPLHGMTPEAVRFCLDWFLRHG